MDTAGGAGLIHERKFRQVNVTRPRLRAGSTKFTGSATCALVKFICAISIRNASGQFSERAASGARIVADSGATGAGFGVNGVGFGARASALARVAWLGVAGWGCPE